MTKTTAYRNCPSLRSKELRYVIGMMGLMRGRAERNVQKERAAPYGQRPKNLQPTTLPLEKFESQLCMENRTSFNRLNARSAETDRQECDLAAEAHAMQLHQVRLVQTSGRCCMTSENNSIAAQASCIRKYHPPVWPV